MTPEHTLANDNNQDDILEVLAHLGHLKMKRERGYGKKVNESKFTPALMQWINKNSDKFRAIMHELKSDEEMDQAIEQLKKDLG